jgi:hypothetical protein
MKITKLGTNLMTLECANAIVLVSYATPVAAWLRNTEGRGCEYVRCVEKFSTTTTKHINAWLRTCATIPIVECDVVPQAEIAALLEEAPALRNVHSWNKLLKQHQAEIDCRANDNLKAMELMGNTFPTLMGR